MLWLNGFYNFRIVGQYLNVFIDGMLTTIWLSLLCLVMSFFFGIFIALMRMSTLGFVWRIAAAYIQLIRSTPLLIQIYLIYYGLPALLPFGNIFDETQTAIIALTIHTTPYMGEIIRTGIQSVDKGQKEGAQAVGLNSFQSMYYIILPQAIANITPPLIGQTAILIKDTALFSIIAVPELMGAGLTMFSETVVATESYVTTGICYLLIYLLTLILSGYAQNRLGGTAWRSN
ncbi:polar amino acid transport system permease protein [Desulfuromusa kysingii]|uniref:Polar amino acid transport system permease protein n=1 Tax=Desulfuromusa kysingii TaxID=37625 RepID=A0A1H4D2J4_9BACT|nr:amino acid ABC transporter permease [Desulfuromusa kysingii]SEA66730.1 polar amino acid transport system permease protein [Desulfuromusa kysingii]